MKKVLSTIALVATILTVTSVMANAATSKKGYYYNGRGSVTYSSATSCRIYARADNTSGLISTVTAKGITNGAQNGYDDGVYWAEINSTGSSATYNEARTGAWDSAGYKENVHARK